MKAGYKEFFSLLDNCLRETQNKNIIIYGSNEGGDFIKWFYSKYYGVQVKTVVDRWELSTVGTILHLWSFYYIYEENDIIINVTPQDIEEEFCDTGEDWKRTYYKKTQILNLWRMLYPNMSVGKKCVDYPQCTYFDWIEHRVDGVDLLNPVKRKYTAGLDAHGYFPTDFRIFIDGLSEYCIQEEDAFLDIGCGKGSGVLALKAAGVRTIGAVEYTESIFDTMIRNLSLLEIPFDKVDSNEISQNEAEIICYLGDAAQMDLELDKYNWFFLFNPFSECVMRSVLDNICKSMRRRARVLRIFYAEPISHNMILETGKFVIEKRICNDYSNVSYYSYIYRSNTQES